MLYMIVEARPPSLQGSRRSKDGFAERLRVEATRLGWFAQRLEGDLYARIAWFHRERPGNLPDVDNVVKPLLDAFADQVETGERRLFDDAQFVHLWVSRHHVDRIEEVTDALGPRGEVALVVTAFLSSHPSRHILYVEFGAASAGSVVLLPPAGAVV